MAREFDVSEWNLEAFTGYRIIEHSLIVSSCKEVASSDQKFIEYFVKLIIVDSEIGIV